MLPKKERNALKYHYVTCHSCGEKQNVICPTLINLQRLAKWVQSCPVPAIFKKAIAHDKPTTQPPAN